MELSAATQEALLCLICFDNTKQGGRLVKTLVPPQSFDKFFREIAIEASKYIDAYKKVPGEHTLDLIRGLMRRDKEAKATYETLWRSMLNTKEGLNREYVVSHAVDFRRHQRCKGILAKALESLDAEGEGYLDQTEAFLASVTKPIAGAELLRPGLVLNNVKEALAFLTTKHVDSYPLGIKEFDDVGVSPFRGGSFLYFAPGNSGKSWFCIHMGKQGLMNRARVLHITLEMSEVEVAGRYIQSLFSVTKREGQKIAAHHFTRDHGGRFTGLDKIIIKGRPSIKDDNIYGVLHKKVVRLLTNKPKIIVRGFPSGMLTIDQLRATLDNLEATERFIPDILIVDYPELMKLDSKNFRIDIGRTHVDLRGLAQERNVALIHVSQANTEGFSAKRLQVKHMAEDRSKFNTADTVMTYSQTRAELEFGLARMESLKVRNEAKNNIVLISQAYAIGQYCYDSARMSDNAYWSQFAAEEEE